MNNKTLKLGLMVAAIGLFASCKSNAQDSNRQRENRQPPSVEETFKAMDADEDGLLSKDEVKGRLKKDFAKIDANEDGFISKEELEKAPRPKGQRPQGRQ